MEARDSKISGNDKMTNPDQEGIDSLPTMFSKVNLMSSSKNSSISDETLKELNKLTSSEEDVDVLKQISDDIEELKKVLEESRKVISLERSDFDSN